MLTRLLISPHRSPISANAAVIAAGSVRSTEMPTASGLPRRRSSVNVSSIASVPACQDGDAGAVIRERLGDRSADALRAAGDDRTASFETQFHLRAPLFVQTSAPMIPPDRRGVVHSGIPKE